MLELVSEPGSIDYRVLPGLRRDDVLAEPAVLEPWERADGRREPWWRLVAG